MKTRQEIEDLKKEMVVPAGQSKTYELLFDILLDIRELLMRQDQRGERQEIKDARRLEELRRISKIKTKLTGERRENG